MLLHHDTTQGYLHSVDLIRKGRKTNLIRSYYLELEGN